VDKLALLAFATLGGIVLTPLWLGSREPSAWRAAGAGALGCGVVVFLLGGAVAPFITVVAMFAFLGAALGPLIGVMGYAMARKTTAGARRVAFRGSALALVAAAAWGCSMPNGRTSVPWPDPGVRLQVENWGWWTSTWWLTVTTGGGSVSVALWEDWGPANRGNIYRTPDGGIAVIGGGELAALVALPADGPPMPLRRAEDDDGDAWTYLGAVIARGGQLSFLSAAEMPECIRRYGEGSVRVRSGFFWNGRTDGC
jgi:hypothetical protein